MTEADWLACADPTPMLEFLRGKASDRKVRLFAVACTRKLWEGMEEPFRRAVEVAEQVADGRLRRKKLAVVRQECDSALSRTGRVGRDHDYCLAGRSVVRNNAWTAASWVITMTEEVFGSNNARDLRDIFGNPFCPAAFDPAWRTSTVLALATGVYDDRAFDRLPILADALEEAGCDNADLLAHCRGDGEHVRGCWAVDLVLGKE
jgi:hypothetical protein